MPVDCINALARQHGIQIGEIHTRAGFCYLGANIPGKTRVFMPYPGGVCPYRQKCN